MMKNNLCIKAFFIQAGPGGVRWGQVGAGGGEILSKKKSSRDLYNVFYCTYDSNSSISNRQCLHLNNLLLSLIPPLLLLCLHWSHPFLRCLLSLIERKKKVESRALKVLKQGGFLLDDEVYISASQVVKRIHRTFWGFAHGEEVIRKSDKTKSWLCGLCKEEGRVKLYPSTSTSVDRKALDKDTQVE